MPRSASSTAMHELGEWLVTNGSATAPVRVASRLLATARERDWDRDPAMLVSWLEELALDVAHAWQTDDPEEPTPSSANTPTLLSSCALGDLVEDRSARGITTEDLRIASAVLSLAGDHQWIAEPAQMADWLQRLASEVAKPSRTLD
jgi:hypothetical protein